MLNERNIEWTKCMIKKLIGISQNVEWMKFIYVRNAEWPICRMDKMSHEQEIEQT